MTDLYKGIIDFWAVLKEYKENKISDEEFNSLLKEYLDFLKQEKDKTPADMLPRFYAKVREIERETKRWTQ